MTYLPFQNTKIGVHQSVSQAMILLESVGFEQVAQLCNRGVYQLLGQHKSIPFQFSVDTQAIVKALIEQSGPRMQAKIRQGTPEGKSRMMDFQERAARIGWRLMAEHIKGVVDAIKLGLFSPATAFAGHVLLKEGQVGEIIEAAAERGELHTPRLLLMERK